MPFLAAADWIEILAALLFFGITGLAQYLQKRSRERRGLPPEEEIDEAEVILEERQRPSGSESIPGSEARPVARDPWEDTWRRLFDEPREPEPTAQVPPPLIEPAAPPASFPPPPVPVERYSRGEQRPAWQVPPERAGSTQVQKGIETIRQAHRTASSRLREVTKAYQDLSGRTRSKLKAKGLDLNLPRVRSLEEERRRRSPAVRKEVASLFRDPKTARQAILAATVLQPPKALE